MQLTLRDQVVDLAEGPVVMGILNVTPDSFSDGGEFVAVERAVARAREMRAEGALIIDVGPESTRPGALPVSAEVQIARAVPVIEALRRVDEQATISIDTRSAQVAEAALAAGADVINDISALREDPQMAQLAARAGCSVILMHMHGTPADMQQGGGPTYTDVVDEVCSFLAERARFATEQGIDPQRLIVDPGLGFGKQVEHNLSLVRHLARVVELGYPVLLGASRKSFIGKVLEVESPNKRAAGSLTCTLLGALAGVAIMRVHEVRVAVEALRMLAAVQRAS